MHSSAENILFADLEAPAESPKATPPRAAEHPSGLTPAEPAYKTNWGAMYPGDGRELLASLPDSCVSAVITSPPYALHFKKEYGNVDKSAYVDWFKPFAQEIRRVLKPDGSFVL